MGTFERACDAYAIKLGKKRTLRGEKETEGGASLNAGIELSLESLEAEFSQCIAEHSLETEHTVSDLYISLCMLSKQMWVPVSVLGRMWQFEEDAALDIVTLFCDMS